MRRFANFEVVRGSELQRRVFTFCVLDADVFLESVRNEMRATRRHKWCGQSEYIRGTGFHSGVRGVPEPQLADDVIEEALGIARSWLRFRRWEDRNK